MQTQPVGLGIVRRPPAVQAIETVMYQVEGVRIVRRESPAFGRLDRHYRVEIEQYDGRWVYEAGFVALAYARQYVDAYAAMGS